MNNTIKFKNIDEFYITNIELLLRSDQYRPCKSVTRDVESTINKFVDYFGLEENIVTNERILAFFDVDTLNDTHNTNIRTMREFGFISLLGDGAFKFTNKYFDFVSKKCKAGLFVLNELYKIKGLDSINMYTNTLLCALREGYTNGYIIGFPDSYHKFKEVITSEDERFQYRKMVYEFYGFSGRGKTIYDDDYTPNANYRVLTELKQLNLIKDIRDSNEKLPRYELTSNALHLLNAIDSNLGNEKEIIISNNFEQKGFNKIFYGIPGCGKSYKVSAMLKHHPDFIEEAKSHGIMKPIKNEYIFRTTFYLDYSNSDFIGQIYPKVTSGEVTYEAIPGPFTKALVKAYDNPEEMVYLVIEEINRGNAAAIFGDTFQLLDRLKVNSNDRLVGSSEYSIFNNFIEGYIVKINKERKENKQKLIPYTEGCVYIPNNLSIFATMNTSDQNVFPLDTAFKRRWEREKVNCNWEKDEFKNKFIPYTDISWYDFGNKVNKLIASNTSDGIMTEDKQIGPYFISMDMLTDKKNVPDKNKLDRFVNNVIDYLFNDVSKFNHEIIFNKKIKSFDAIEDIIEEDLKNYDQIKDQIFKNVLNIDFYKKQLEGSDGQEA